MGTATELLDDPAFRRLLRQRNRWRWGLSGLLIGIYLVYGVLGVYLPEAYAAPLGNSSLPSGLVAGLSIILLTIVLSMIYVRIANRLESSEVLERDRQR